MTLPKGYKARGGGGGGSGGGSSAAILIGIIVFIIGLIILVGTLAYEWSTPIEDQDVIGASTKKIVGIFMMIIPVALGMGLSSGTGRPYGGAKIQRRAKFLID